MCHGYTSQHQHHAGGCCGQYRPADACGCHGYAHGPGVYTREEAAARLERYLVGLQEEAQRVKERLAALKEE